MIAPRCLWPYVYEQEMDSKTGIKLGELEKGKPSGIEEIARRDISVLATTDRELNEVFFSHQRDLYPNYPNACSMKIQDERELEEHVNFLYQTMYYHYALGKQENINGKFPDTCCLPSSMNVIFSLMKKGYSNVVGLDSYYKDHYYLGLPFIMEKTQEKGWVILDPTSDQLWEDRTISKRNLIFIANSNKWTYKTDWAGAGDLFPDYYINLGTLRKQLRYDNDVEECFEKVFQTQVKIEVPKD